jgi:hypothetical protein
LERAYGTLLLAYDIARAGADKAIPGCTTGDLVTDVEEYRKMLLGTNVMLLKRSPPPPPPTHTHTHAHARTIYTACVQSLHAKGTFPLLIIPPPSLSLSICWTTAGPLLPHEQGPHAVGLFNVSTNTHVHSFIAQGAPQQAINQNIFSTVLQLAVSMTKRCLPASLLPHLLSSPPQQLSTELQYASRVQSVLRHTDTAILDVE